MRKPLAFVLGGGGARGALQVGALRALYEAGYRPDMMVGTSAGAVNATYLALRGFDEQGLDQLEQAWLEAARQDLLPPNYLKLTLRVLLKRPAGIYSNRMQQFFVNQGLSPNLRFRDLSGFHLVTVTADLISGKPVLYGTDQEQSVLEGLLASTAIPPWIAPRLNNEQLLVDGGALSSLPIEPALALGAREIIALDLIDLRGLMSMPEGIAKFIYQYITAVENRHSDLERELAAARGIPVRYLHLLAPDPVPIWDFTRSAELIPCGYELAWKTIPTWRNEKRSLWSRLFPARRPLTQG